MMKELEWIGSSKKDLQKFPKEVRYEIGYALYLAQQGETSINAKIFKGFGSGIYEIVSDCDKNAYRAVYIVNFHDKVYVLHAFQKNQKKVLKPQNQILML